MEIGSGILNIKAEDVSLQT